MCIHGIVLIKFKSGKYNRELKFRWYTIEPHTINFCPIYSLYLNVIGGKFV